MYVACQNGHVDVVRQLVRAGADVNACRNDGATPLFAACIEDDNNSSNANAAPPTNQPQPPPPCSSSNRARDVVSALLSESGAGQVDTDLCRNDGVTPLHLAVHSRNLAVAKLLVEYGASVNYRTAHQDALTPLRIAVQHDHDEMVKLLLLANADPVQLQPADSAKANTDTMSYVYVLALMSIGVILPNFGMVARFMF